MAARVRGHVAPSRAAGGSSRSVGTQGGRGGGTACPWGDRWELPPHRRAWVFSCPSWVPFLSQGAGTTCGSVLGCSCPRSHPQPAPFHKWGNRGTTWQRPSLLSSAGEEQAGDGLPGVPRHELPRLGCSREMQPSESPWLSGPRAATLLPHFQALLQSAGLFAALGGAPLLERPRPAWHLAHCHSW